MARSGEIRADKLMGRSGPEVESFGRVGSVPRPEGTPCFSYHVVHSKHVLEYLCCPPPSGTLEDLLTMLR